MSKWRRGFWWRRTFTGLALAIGVVLLLIVLLKLLLYLLWTSGGLLILIIIIWLIWTRLG